MIIRTITATELLEEQEEQLSLHDMADRPFRLISRLKLASDYAFWNVPYWR